MKTENGVAKTCKTFAVIIWILGFIVGIIVGGKTGSAFVTGYFWGGCFVVGLFFYAFGELLGLLESIKNKINLVTTDNSEIKEKQDTVRDTFIPSSGSYEVTGSNTFILSSGTYKVGEIILPNIKYDLKVIEGKGQIIVDTNGYGSKLAIGGSIYSNLILKPNSILIIPDCMKVEFEARNSDKNNSILNSLLVKGDGK